MRQVNIKHAFLATVVFAAEPLPRPSPNPATASGIYRKQ
jgi:hypothetical protein